MVFWEGYISDELMGTVAPIAVYWIYGGAYQLLLLLPALQQYRLHPREEEGKNAVALRDVVKAVLFQQCLQAAVAQLLFLAASPVAAEPVRQPGIAVQLLQILVAMAVNDTWQYFIHRWLHRSPLLYRHIHSRHHRLVVTYALGALYNHPLEGLLVDTLGGAVAYLVSGMTSRTAVYFFCLAVMKAVDDHCGLRLPWNPFQAAFENNCGYHDVHHQSQWVKYNFSQPFFPFWDKIMGTHMPHRLVARPGGGFEARPVSRVINKKTEDAD